MASWPVRAFARLVVFVLAFASLNVAYGPRLFAQTTPTPVVTGHVVDQNNAAVAGARVTLRRAGTGVEFSAVTDAAGAFEFGRLVEGAYRLSASGEGFTTATRELSLASGETRDLNVVLQAGVLAEEIVVTSTRVAATAEAVENIPGAVEVIDQETLEASRVFTTSEALRKASGVNVRDEEGFGLRPNIGIRGLNPTRSTKVLLLEDGIPLTYAPYGDNASYYHPPIDRFEAVEVLKGSGQILFGPSTVGGVVNYVTRTPPVKRTGALTLTGGNRDYFNGHLSYGGTWGATGLLFDFTRKQGEGARDQHRSGLSDFNFKSVSTLGSKHALTTKFNYYRERSQVSYSGLTEAEYAADPRQNPFFNDRFYGDRVGASVTHAYVFNPSAVLTTNLYGSYFKRHWWRQSSNSGERPNRLGSDPDCRGMQDLNTTCGNQGRLRKYHFVGVEPRLHLTHHLFGVRSEADMGARAHFETQQRRQENGDLPDSRTGTLVEHNERRNRAYSGFVENRFFIGDWTVTPGLRVEHVRFERTNRLAGASGRTSLTQLVPGLGVSYSPSGRLTVFAGAHRGFAPPRTEDIINNTTGGVIELDPELSWNYEVGLRSALTDGVRLEATLFRMDYENQIVPASLAGGVGATLTNGGETLHQGLEFSGRLDTGALLKSRHNFYARAAYTFLPVARFEGTRLSSIVIAGESARPSVNGNRLPYAPEHLLTATFGYSHPSGFDGQLEAVHVASQFADDRNFTTVPEFVGAVPVPASLRLSGQLGLIPSYTAWNATANYNVEHLRTTFFVTVKNVFDSTYIVDRSRGILPSSPRLVQAGLKYRF
ncbi:MAG TPA: TonB-dependent receptor [Pyrinomonadaceae bacterium]|nr:TonB-dependent receptor [Pyrinomonadaceae bacterium]